MSWVDEFIETEAKRPRAAGGWDKSMRRWKDTSQKEKRTKIVALHTLMRPKLYYQHPFPKVVQYTDKDTKEQVTKIYKLPHVCPESTAYLHDQMFWKNGVPQVRPAQCAICKTWVAVRELVVAGKLSWVDPVFEFESIDDKGRPFTDQLLAGGLYGAFNKKQLDEEERKEMKRAHVYPSTAWQQSIVAKAQWAFAVVDLSAVSDGVQLVSEAALLGEKIQGIIIARRKSLGVEDGDITVNPCAMEWTHDPTQSEFSKKYDACFMEKEEITDEALAFLRDPYDSAELTKLLTLPDPDVLRDFMEEHCVAKGLDFDAIFKDAPRPEEAPKDAPKESAPKASPAPRAASRTKAEPPPAPPSEPAPKAEPPKTAGRRQAAPAVPMIPCDVCKAPMKETDTECPKCGEKYVIDDDLDIGGK